MERKPNAFDAAFDSFFDQHGAQIFAAMDHHPNSQAPRDHSSKFEKTAVIVALNLGLDLCDVPQVIDKLWKRHDYRRKHEQEPGTVVVLTRLDIQDALANTPSLQRKFKLTHEYRIDLRQDAAAAAREALKSVQSDPYQWYLPTSPLGFEWSPTARKIEQAATKPAEKVPEVIIEEPDHFVWKEIVPLTDGFGWIKTDRNDPPSMSPKAKSSCTL